MRSLTQTSLYPIIIGLLAVVMEARDRHKMHRSLDIDSEEGEQIAKFMNQRRGKLAEGSKRFKLKWASKMYKLVGGILPPYHCKIANFRSGTRS